MNITLRAFIAIGILLAAVAFVVGIVITKGLVLMIAMICVLIASAISVAVVGLYRLCLWVKTGK